MLDYEIMCIAYNVADSTFELTLKGGTATVPYPCETWLSEPINAWLKDNELEVIHGND